MDEWQEKFETKSERRRRRSKRRRLIRRTTIIICVSLAILFGLWLIDKMGSGLGSEPRTTIHVPRR
jgi:hypothetical protein